MNSEFLKIIDQKRKPGAEKTEKEALPLKGTLVQVSAPGKIILHGEHSVVYGKLALAASLGLKTTSKLAELDRPNQFILKLPDLKFTYTCELQKLKEHFLDQPLPLIQNPKEFNWEAPDFIHHDTLIDMVESFINTTTDSTLLTSSQLVSLKSTLYLVAGILGSVNVELSSFLLKSETELSIGAGTGSSASFAVSIAGALVQYVKLKSRELKNFSKDCYNSSGWATDIRHFNRRELDMICKWALCAEKIVHGTPSGIDNTICTYGSMVEFRKGLAPKLLEIKQPFQILLINTKVTRDTKKLVAKVAQLYNKYPDLTNNILNAMEDVSFLALKHISSLCGVIDEDGQAARRTDEINQHYNELGRLATINHNLLNSLGVSHIKLEEAIYVLSENGLHGKLTGAGGGGYATCLVPPHEIGNVGSIVMDELNRRGFDVSLVDLGGPGITVDLSW